MGAELLTDEGAGASGSSLSQAAVGLGATALRETGLASPSQETTAQAALLVEAMVARLPGLGRESLGRDPESAGWTFGRVVGLMLAVFCACILAMAVGGGVWMVDKRVTAIEGKLGNVALVKARQDALVLHLLASVKMIADAQGVTLPRPNAVLRIAEAEAAQAANQ